MVIVIEYNVGLSKLDHKINRSTASLVSWYITLRLRWISVLSSHLSEIFRDSYWDTFKGEIFICWLAGAPSNAIKTSNQNCLPLPTFMIVTQYPWTSLTCLSWLDSWSRWRCWRIIFSLFIEYIGWEFSVVRPTIKMTSRIKQSFSPLALFISSPGIFVFYPRKYSIWTHLDSWRLFYIETKAWYIN